MAPHRSDLQLWTRLCHPCAGQRVGVARTQPPRPWAPSGMGSLRATPMLGRCAAWRSARWMRLCGDLLGGWGCVWGRGGAGITGSAHCCNACLRLSIAPLRWMGDRAGVGRSLSPCCMRADRHAETNGLLYGVPLCVFSSSVGWMYEAFFFCFRF